MSTTTSPANVTSGSSQSTSNQLWIRAFDFVLGKSKSSQPSSSKDVIDVSSGKSRSGRASDGGIAPPDVTKPIPETVVTAKRYHGDDDTSDGSVDNNAFSMADF